MPELNRDQKLLLKETLERANPDLSPREILGLMVDKIQDSSFVEQFLGAHTRIQAETDEEYKTQEQREAEAQKIRQVAEMRRQVTQPTPEEFDRMSTPEKAAFLSQKTGQSYEEAYSDVASMPYVTQKVATQGGITPMGAMTSFGGDVLSGFGRGAGAGLDAIWGDDYTESLGQTGGRTGQGQERSLLGGIGQDVLRSPSTIPSIATGAGALGLMAKMGLGAKATIPIAGALSGLADVGTQDIVTQDDVTAGDYALGGGLGAGGEVLGAVGGKVIKGGLGKLSNLTKEAIETGTKTPYGALKKASTPEGRAVLGELAGSEFAVGQDLIGDVFNMTEKHMAPEARIIADATAEMAPVDISTVKDAMESALIKPKGGRALKKWELKANELIQEEIDDIVFEVADASAPNMLNAEGALDLRRSIDATPDFSNKIDRGDEITKAVSKSLQKGRNALQKGLIESAESSGQPEYVTAMKSLSEKFDLSTKMKKNIGSTPEIAEPRVEGYMKNIAEGGNKSQQRRNLQQLDDLLGTDYGEKAQVMAYSKLFPPKTFKPDEAINVPLATLDQTGGTFAKAASVVPFGPVASPKMAASMTVPALTRLDALLARPSTVAPAVVGGTLGSLVGRSDPNDINSPLMFRGFE